MGSDGRRSCRRSRRRFAEDAACRASHTGVSPESPAERSRRRAGGRARMRASLRMGRRAPAGGRVTPVVVAPAGDSRRMRRVVPPTPACRRNLLPNVRADRRAGARGCGRACAWAGGRRRSGAGERQPAARPSLPQEIRGGCGVSCLPHRRVAEISCRTIASSRRRAGAWAGGRRRAQTSVSPRRARRRSRPGRMDG